MFVYWATAVYDSELLGSLSGSYLNVSLSLWDTYMSLDVPILHLRPSGAGSLSLTIPWCKCSLSDLLGLFLVSLPGRRLHLFFDAVTFHHMLSLTTLKVTFQVISSQVAVCGIYLAHGKKQWQHQQQHYFCPTQIWVITLQSLQFSVITQLFSSWD